MHKLQEFMAKSVEYDRLARKASDDLVRESYIGLAEAYRDLSQTLLQLEMQVNKCLHPASHCGGSA